MVIPKESSGNSLTLTKELEQDYRQLSTYVNPGCSLLLPKEYDDYWEVFGIRQCLALVMETPKIKHVAADMANLPINGVISKQNSSRIILQLSIHLES